MQALNEAHWFLYFSSLILLGGFGSFAGFMIRNDKNNDEGFPLFAIFICFNIGFFIAALINLAHVLSRAM